MTLGRGTLSAKVCVVCVGGPDQDLVDRVGAVRLFQAVQIAVMGVTDKPWPISLATDRSAIHEVCFARCAEYMKGNI